MWTDIRQTEGQTGLNQFKKNKSKFGESCLHPQSFDIPSYKESCRTHTYKRKHKSNINPFSKPEKKVSQFFPIIRKASIWLHITIFYIEKTNLDFAKKKTRYVPKKNKHNLWENINSLEEDIKYLA